MGPVVDQMAAVEEITADQGADTERTEVRRDDLMASRNETDLGSAPSKSDIERLPDSVHSARRGSPHAC